LFARGLLAVEDRAKVESAMLREVEAGYAIIELANQRQIETWSLFLKSVDSSLAVNK